MLLFPPPGDLPDPGIEPTPLTALALPDFPMKHASLLWFPCLCVGLTHTDSGLIAIQSRMMLRLDNHFHIGAYQLGIFDVGAPSHNVECFTLPKSPPQRQRYLVSPRCSSHLSEEPHM